MKFTKPATTIEQQAQLMIDRGLVVSDRARLERELRTIGYYRLSAYWLPFETPPIAGTTRSKRFRAGTRHEDIVDLYIFDRKLRLRIMEALERIEIALRASWSNQMALASGPHAHMMPHHFNDPWQHAAMLAKLANSLETSQEVFVTHYKRKYREPYMPPVWAVTEKMTMGELSKWFAATASNNVRTQIARDMGIPSKELLGSIIATLSYVRNLCAHHSRLWNRRLVKRLPKIKKYGADLVMNAQDGSQTDNLIYNVMVVCLHMLRVQSPQTTYGARLIDLVETVTESQRAAMGFPTDWRTRPIWQTIPKAANP